MHTLLVSEISISQNRQRREFDEQALMELQESIEKTGLMQPIVVRDTGEGWVLVAGERRMRAIAQMRELGGMLKHGGMVVRDDCLPVVTMGELSPLEAYEAELTENLYRVDLTWQERATAVAKLHELRQASCPEHSVADTAEEVTGRRDGWYHGETREQIILARHLDNPAIADAKTAKEAFKILRREESSADFAARGVLAGATFGRHSHKAIQGNCLAYLESADADQFDVICTDPPYGMGADSFGDGAGRLTRITHEYSDDATSFRKLMGAVIPLLGRVCKAQAAIYMCCDLDQFHWLKGTLAEDNWYVFRTPLINVKSGSGRVPLPDNGPRRQYEFILYAFRGGRKVNFIASDVITTLGDEQLGHGAQKPVELFRNLLGRSVRPGDSVLDPFAGTGTIFPAGHALKCAVTGVEMEPAYYGMCVKRIEELK